MSSNFDGSPLLRDDESMLLYDDGSDARARRLGSLIPGDALSESDGSSNFDWNWETDPEFSKIDFVSNAMASKDFGFVDAMKTSWGIGALETAAHVTTSGFGSMLGGILATGAGLSAEALDVVNRAFGWEEYNVSADSLVDSINFFRDTFAYEPRTEIGKLMTYGFEAYNSISSQPFNSLKTGLGDLGYEWGGSFGPLLGAGLSALPDAALLYAGYRLSAPSTTTRGLAGGEFGAVVSDDFVASSSINNIETRTIGELFPETHPDTMIHLTSFPLGSFSDGINEGTFFARLGDVSHLTPLQYKVGVVGPFAAGYGPEANLFIGVAPANAYEFELVGKTAFGYREYTNPWSVYVDHSIEIPSGPSLPYPEMNIPMK